MRWSWGPFIITRCCDDWLITLPDVVRRALDGYATTGDDLRTASESAVFRYRRGGDGLILKCTRSRSDALLSREAAVMEWLDGKLDVPRVVCCHEQDGSQYLVVTCLSGISGQSKELQSEVPTLVRLFAEGLERIRAVPTVGCPFDHTPDALVAHAWSRIADDRIPQSWIEDTGMGSDATAVVKE